MSAKFINSSLGDNLESLGKELENIIVESPPPMPVNEIKDLLQNDIAKKYILTLLYGPKIGKRSPLDKILPELEKEFADNSAAVITQLENIGEKSKSLARQIIDYGQKGLAKDSIEIDNLFAEGNDIAPLIKTYLAQCFENMSMPQSEPPKSDKTEITPEINTKIIFIKEHRSWGDDVDTIRNIEKYIAEITEYDASLGQKVRKIYSDGQKLQKIMSQAFSCGFSKNENELEKLKKEAKKLNALPFEIKKIERQYQKGMDRAASSAKNRKIQKNIVFPEPDFDSDMANPFYIGNLAHAKNWNIFIDETGNRFDHGALNNEISKKDKGRFVAVLLPENSDLEEISSFHATDSDTLNIIKILEKLLCKSKVRSGIIGVTLDGMAKIPINYWYNGLERLFDLILRLLPVEDNTVLNFMIEERGSSTSAMVQRCADSSLYRLAKANPARAAKIEVKADVYNKKSTADKTFIAYNGYVDSLACAWNGRRPELVKILENYGLLNSCLLEGETQELHTVLDAVTANDFVSPEIWKSLLNSPDSVRHDSIVSKIISMLGNNMKDDIVLYKQYLDAVIYHLNSKAINIRALAKEINFLKKYQPSEAIMPPRLQLLWLTAKLAEANHRGNAEFAAEERFKNLIAELYEEDAPLCCWATLHLAVKYTNAFQFDSAFKLVNNFMNTINAVVPCNELPSDFNRIFEKIISALTFPVKVVDTFKKILNARPAKPAAITGLQYYGQLFSSRGQHWAFMGENGKAIEDFTFAIEIFNKLSIDDKYKDISQTGAYLMTAVMDYDSSSENDLRNAEKIYFGEDIQKNIKSITVSNNDADKYKLHILMRYIASGKAPEYIKNIVLQQKNTWKCGSGHPWEMIEFYRALLADSADERIKHFKQAHQLSQGYDATLHVIDAVILGSLLLDDNSVVDEYIQLVDTCEKELPYLGNRINILREQPQVRRPPLDLAKKVLPFNFR